MTDRSKPEWFFSPDIGSTVKYSEPPKATDIESLRRKNLSCSARAHLGRIQSSLNYGKEQREKLEKGIENLYFMSKFLQYYQLSMDGPLDGDYPEQPWFPLLEMALSLFKTYMKVELPEEIRERLEASLLSTFVSQVKGLGFNNPEGRSDG